MKQESSSQGFGLAVFSLLLLAGAYILVFYRTNAIFAALMSLLAAIIGTAAFIEARRANGPKMFAIIVLILAILGTLFLLGRTGSMVSKKNPTVIIKEEPAKELRDNEEKMQEMEKKLEKLEQGSDKKE